MISESVYLNWLLVMPFFAALCAFAFPRLSVRPHSEAEAEALPRAPFALGALICVLGVSLATSLLIIALRGEPVAADYWWTRGAYQLRFRADTLTAVALLVLYAVGFLVLLHHYSLPTPELPHARAALLLCLIGGIGAALLCSDLVLLVFCLQIAAFSAWRLAVLEAPDGADRLFLTVFAGSLLVLAGVLLAWRLAGNTTMFGLTLALVGAAPEPLQQISALLLVGITPLSLALPGLWWLPPLSREHPRLALSLALLLGVLGTYLTLRLLPGSLVIGQLPAVSSLGLLLGLLTLWWGAASLWTARSLHQAATALAAAQAGQLLVALGAAASPTALSGALQATALHVLAAPLALAAVWSALGVILARVQADALPALSGLWRKLPLAGIALLLGGLSIAGLPPLAGFWSQRLVVQSLLHDGRTGITLLFVLADVLLIIGTLSVFRQAFLRQAPPALQPDRRWQQPQLALSVLAVVAAAALTGPLAEWSRSVATQILSLTPK